MSMNLSCAVPQVGFEPTVSSLREKRAFQTAPLGLEIPPSHNSPVPVGGISPADENRTRALCLASKSPTIGPLRIVLRTPDGNRTRDARGENPSCDASTHRSMLAGVVHTYIPAAGRYSKFDQLGTLYPNPGVLGDRVVWTLPCLSSLRPPVISLTGRTLKRHHYLCLSAGLLGRPCRF
jgi:hypothetical protein